MADAEFINFFEAAESLYTLVAQSAPGFDIEFEFVSQFDGIYNL